MTLAWVTAAFLGARGDRPANYYLQPLEQITRRVLASPFRLVVWTWDQSLREIKSVVPEECILVGDPMQLCLRTSDDYRWRLLGRDLHMCPWDMMCRYTDMLAVYMSRPAIIEQTFDRMPVDACLWMDCGWTNSVIGRCDDQVFDTWKLETTAAMLDSLLQEHQLLLCRAVGQKEASHAHVSKFNIVQECFVPGGMWACSRQSIKGFIKNVRDGWRFLLSHGYVQDDECAMTIAMWANSLPSLDQADWYNLIQGQPPQLQILL